MARRGAGGAPYEFVCGIAEGGMATVSLVLRREGEFARPYAMKRLRPALANEPDVQAMFADEARIAGLLRHPNVVSVLDVGRDDDGVYLVMDYVDGLPLSALYARVRASGEPIPLQIALRIAIQVARGLHAAHEQTANDGTALGLVHRDVSPQNILVSLDGSVRVTDFGIAKALGRRSKTTTGILKGKTGYIAPELLRFQEPDRRADLFSLGVVLYEMVVGRRLYGEPDMARAARRILEEPAPDVGMERQDVPDELVELCFELLAKKPELRPSDARTVGQRLSAILGDLVAREGPFELDDYLAEHIDAGALRERRALIEDVQAGRVKPRPIAAERVDAQRTRTLWWGRRGWRRIAVAAALVLGGVGLGMALTASGREDVAEAEVAKVVPEGESESGSEGGSESESGSESERGSESEVAEGVAEESAPEPVSVMEERTARGRVVRERRRRAQRAQREPAMEGEPDVLVVDVY